MTKPKEENERLRKIYSSKGTRGQKHIAFRCDYENLEWLDKQPNKGRYINNLISTDRQQRQQPQE